MSRFRSVLLFASLRKDTIERRLFLCVSRETYFAGPFLGCILVRELRVVQLAAK
jgi:hypothetical protein